MSLLDGHYMSGQRICNDQITQLQSTYRWKSRDELIFIVLHDHNLSSTYSNGPNRHHQHMQRVETCYHDILSPPHNQE